jgi:hypothetical protein
MVSAGEVLDRYPQLRAQTEVVPLANLLVYARARLEAILDHYGVRSVQELREKLEARELPEHPAYEDYLDAVAYEEEVRAVGEALRRKVEELIG